MGGLDVIGILKVLPAVVLGLTIHEYAHGLVAYKLGDSTAKDMGRMTINPLKHIDPLGFILIIIAGFGWAKPVIFNPENLKNKQRDEILISLAGPFSNLALGVLLFIIARLLYGMNIFNSTDFGKDVIQLFLLSGIINFGLFIFNLIPLPPLDGSHIYLAYIKKINTDLFNKLYRYGTLALLGIIIFESQSNVTILPIRQGIHYLTNFLIKLLRFN